MQIITANRLDNGLVVYQTSAGSWSEEIAKARVHQSESAPATALEAAQADMRARIVLDPYTIDVADKDGRIVPVQLRERIRAQGPTVAYAVPAVALDSAASSRRAA